MTDAKDLEGRGFDEQKIFYNISFSLLSILFLLFVSASVCFVLGIGLNGFGILLSFILGMGAPVFLKISDIKEFLPSFVIIFGIIALSLYLAEAMADVSYDGRWYHQTNALFLKKGWNPVYVRAADFLKEHWTVKSISGLTVMDSYPKAVEIIAASFFYLTDNIETCKAVNPLAMAALFFYSLYIFNAFFPNLLGILRFFLSFAVIINPVVLAQMHTGYVDGLIYVCFMFALLSIIELEKTDRQSKSGLLIFIMSITLLSGIKTSSGLYAAEIILLYLIYLKCRKKNIEKPGKILIALVALLFVTNINPYLTNLYQGKHLFYPIMGKDKIDVITHNVPTYFFNRSMPYKLFMSLFTSAKNSSFEHPETNTPIKVKTPFTRSDEEKRNLGFADLRLSGFGVWWGGILILSLFLAPFSRKIPEPDSSLYHLLMLILIVSVLTHPHNWWARYVPQLYALPIFIILFFAQRNFSVYRHAFSLVLLLFMTINSLFTYTEVVVRNVIRTEMQKSFYASPAYQRRNLALLLDPSGVPHETQTIPALMLTEKDEE
ncbi:MAG: hypothetical protein J5787_02390 [Alphaproteobacteria bacterium]|nr:hypothetical protein [Alphaproteobacteria bacterium]